MNNPHSDKAHKYIKNKILMGDLKPGERLKTQDLAKTIGVSATPIRDALRILENEGLVEILPRLGASVKSLDISGYRELSEVRCALECLAAELAANNRTDAELAEIESALNEMGAIVGLSNDAISAENLQSLRVADIRFHVAILSAAHNNTLYSEVLRLQVIHRINSPSLRTIRSSPTVDAHVWRSTVYECHKRIFLGIRDRKADAARDAMKEHIQGIIDRAVTSMAKSLQSSNMTKIENENIGFIE